MYIQTLPFFSDKREKTPSTKLETLRKYDRSYISQNYVKRNEIKKKYADEPESNEHNWLEHLLHV